MKTTHMIGIALAVLLAGTCFGRALVFPAPVAPSYKPITIPAPGMFGYHMVPTPTPSPTPTPTPKPPSGAGKGYIPTPQPRYPIGPERLPTQAPTPTPTPHH